MSSPHILVVDDEADIRGLLKEILSEEGYEVDVAANAAQARALARPTRSPISCCSTSGCRTWTGSRCCVNGRPPAADGCPVVMMSGHGTVETAVEATRLGAFDFVGKTAVAREAAAHRGARPGCGPAASPGGQASSAFPARGYRFGKSRAHAAAARGAAADGAAIPPRYCWSANRAPDARPSRVICTSTVRVPARRSCRSSPRACATRTPRAGCSAASRRTGRRLRVFWRRRATGRCSSRARGPATGVQRLLVGVFESGQFTRLGEPSR